MQRTWEVKDPKMLEKHFSASIRNFLCVGLLLMILLIRFSETIFGGKSISNLYLNTHWDSLFYQFKAGPNFGMDPSFIQLSAPYLFFVSDYWHSGLPLWNQFTGFGAPLLADPQAFVLSPLFALFRLIPQMHVWNITLVIQLAICLASTYFLCLEFEGTALSAVIAALLFTFCPWVQFETELLGQGICLTPVVFLFFVRAAKSKSLWYAVFAGFAAAVDLLSAHPEMSFMTILFACLLMLLVATYHRHKEFCFFNLMLRIALSGLVAFGISAPMLVPFGEYLLVGETYKFSCAGTSGISMFGLFATFVYPFYRFGSVFLGPLSWFGVAAALNRLFDPGRALLKPIFICLIFSALAVTKSFPLNILFSIPPFLQVHEMYCLPAYVLCLSLTSGLGIELLLDKSPLCAARSRSLAFQSRSVTCILGIAPLALVPIVFYLWQHNRFSVDFDFLQESPRFAWKWWLVDAACAAVVIYARYIFISQYSVRKTLMARFILAAGAIGLIAVSVESLPIRPTFRYPDVCSLHLRNRTGERTLSIGNHLFRPTTNLVYKIPMLSAWNPVFPKGYPQFVSECGALRTNSNTFTFTADMGRLIDLAGVRTILSTQPLLDECALPALELGSNRSLTARQILYQNLLALNDVTVFRDSKAKSVFCRAKATPLTSREFALRFDIRDTRGNLISTIEPQPIWNGFSDQTVVCSGFLPTAIKNPELLIRVIEQGSGSVLLPAVASGGKIRSDGSVMLGHLEDVGLANEVSNARFKAIASCGNVITYENRNAMDRCFFVRGIVMRRANQPAGSE
jgi:hypothetical protein